MLDLAPEPDGLRDTGLDEATLRRRLARTWATPQGLIGSLASVDHKIVARRYLVTAFVFLGLGGLNADADALAAVRTRAGPDRAGSLQPAVHDARRDDDVPVRRARHAGERDLPRSAHGGHAQHRLPAPECLQLLDLSVGWHLRLDCLPAQYGTRRRLVRLRAVVGAGIRSRQAGRRLGADDHLYRGVIARRRGRHHRHGAEAARTRHVARPHPAVRLVDAGDVVRDHLRHAGSDDRLDLPDPRPAGRHPHLQSGRGRRRAAVPASVLVLRPSGSLHHLPASNRHGLVDHRRVRAPAGVRLSGAGALVDRGGLSRHSGSGSTICLRLGCPGSAPASSPRPA